MTMSSSSSSSVSSDKVISTLNSLLQGERSAVETYSKAQTHLAGSHAGELETNKASHANRVTILANRITQLGGKPTMEGGLWVGFTKIIEQGAAMLSKALVISALEQGEDIGLADYRDALDDLDPESRMLVTRDLLPAQELTHQRMSTLKNAR